MYAVVSSGGKQYRVSEGDRVALELLPGNVGDSVVLDQVLFVGDSESGSVGTPFVAGAKVVGKIEGLVKDDKKVIFKFKKRKMIRRKTGHRQSLASVLIESIQTGAK